MYNQEQKERFITLLQAQRKKTWAETLFKWTAPSEALANKDIAQMTNQEITSAVASGIPQGASLKTIPHLADILKSYLQWAQQTGQKVVVDFDTLRSPIEAYIRKFFVASPSALQERLDIVFAPEENETVDNIYRAMVWLQYIGIGMEQIGQLQTSDVDLDHMCIVCDGLVFPLYQESLACIKNCVFLERLRFAPNDNKRCGETESLPRVRSNKLLRTARSKNSTYESIRAMLLARAAQKNQSFHPGMLRRSNYFYREYQKELQGFNPDFIAIINEEFQAQRTRQDTLEDYISNKLPLYTKHYKWWKAVFYGPGIIDPNDVK